MMNVKNGADGMSEFNAMQEQLKALAKKNNTGNIDMSAYDAAPYPDEQTIPYIPDDEPQMQYEQQQEPPHIEPNDDYYFDGGPLISEIESWKKQYGEVYIVDDIPGDNIYIYRTINRYEYKSIMAQQNTDPLMREEMICDICVLFPYDFSYAVMSNVNAGIPSLLAEHIMETSGFTRASTPRRL